jgi:anti-sigma B factor antagonist
VLRETDETCPEDGTQSLSRFGSRERAELTVVETKRSSSDRARRAVERFGVNVERRGHVTIVQPHGELDLATVETLRSALEAAVTETLHAALDGMEIPARLVLDLRGLSFMDSTGLHLLADLDRRATRDGFQLTLLAPAKPVDRAIQLSGLDKSLPFVTPDVTAVEHREPKAAS